MWTITLCSFAAFTEHAAEDTTLTMIEPHHDAMDDLGCSTASRILAHAGAGASKGEQSCKFDVIGRQNNRRDRCAQGIGQAVAVWRSASGTVVGVDLNRDKLNALARHERPAKYLRGQRG